MTTFETLLDRLARHRGWDTATLAGIADGDLDTPAALRRLAPALGWRTADLFALAQQDLPDDLAPTDWQANPGTLIWDMTNLPPARPILLAAARSLPLLPRAESPPWSTPLPDVPGAVIGRLLFSRNLRTGSSAELLMVAGGPYLAASTIRAICIGRKALDAHIVSGFANGLGIPVGDLAALCAVEVTELLPAPEYAADLADMIWECRRLTQEQIDELRRLGHELRHRFDDDLTESARCHCQARSRCCGHGRPHPRSSTGEP